MISFTEVHKHLQYDPDTGKLWWRTRASGRRMNKPAGSKDGNGYICVYVLGKLYRSHRLIWFMQTGSWPKEEIDHANGKRADNKWRNLREATHSQNRQNSRRHKNNKSGVKGVTWHTQHRKWYVTIQKDNKPKFIGLFASKQKARKAYIDAANAHFGEFARAA